VTAANYVQSAGMAIDARTVLVGDSEWTRRRIADKTIKVESERTSIKRESKARERRIRVIGTPGRYIYTKGPWP